MNNTLQKYFLCACLLALYCTSGAADNVSTEQKVTNETFLIVNIPECKEDIEKHCSRVQSKRNYDILDCLRGGPEKPTVLKTECEHILWQYQMSVTKKVYFDDIIRKFCGPSYESIKECQDPAIVKEMGGDLYCLLDYKDKVTDEQCSHMLNSAAKLVFFDYATMKPFLTHCENDITQLQCGRISASTPTQDSVLTCLAEKVMNLSDACHHQVLRVAELQGEDYHLDRSLYFACRESREVVCKKVKSGKGRVLKCLMENKMSNKVSDACKKQLSRRQTLRSEDYRTDYSLTQCEADIAKYQCAVTSPTHPEQKLASVMLCLENAAKVKKEGLHSECQGELLSLKHQLYNDLSITPSIMLECSQHIKDHCQNDLHSNGFHCLMDLYRKTPERPKSVLSEGCERAIIEMLYLLDPSENIIIDPVISEACEKTISYGVCREKAHRGFNVYNCLLRLAIYSVDDSQIDLVCKDKIFQMNTVLGMEFSLNAPLFKACHNDAVKLCYGMENWYKKDAKGRLSAHGQGIFHCLYDKMRSYDDFKEIQEAEAALPDKEKTHKKGDTEPPSIDNECRKELKENLKMQAAHIEMNPLVYEACLTDLSAHCMGRKNDYDGFQCLQDNLEELREGCRKEVVLFSEQIQKDVSLDSTLQRVCAPMFKIFCHHLIGEDKEPNHEEAFKCMVEAKNDPGMDPICRIGIEHEQIIALKDFHISHRFRLFCEGDVKRYCSDKKKKAEVIKCLSEQATWDYVEFHSGKDSYPRLKPKCREMLRFEILQRSQDIKLDPELHQVCKNDISNYCNDIDSSKVLDCLQSNQDRISSSCRKILFSRELIMAKDNRLDARLMSACGRMIEKYCHHTDEQRNAIDCLREAMETKNDFDKGCIKVLVVRLELRGRDYRLDPNIVNYCEKDIKKHCDAVLSSNKHASEEEYQGRILECLRDQFEKSSRGDPSLSEDCRKTVSTIVSRISLHIYMDPFMKHDCKADLQEHCPREVEDSNGIDQDGHQIECLKRALFERKKLEAKCRVRVLRLVRESQADVHSDPMLSQNCANELRFLCEDVPSGRAQQLICLLTEYEKKTSHISKPCARVLDVRIKLWQEIEAYNTIEGLGSLITRIQNSSARVYLISVLLLIVLIVFIQGIICARYAHKVPISWKNK